MESCTFIAISRRVRLANMPHFDEWHTQGRLIHLHATTLTHNHSPGAEHRKKGASDGQRAHRCALCSCTAVRQCTGCTCCEVGLALRAIWTTSWLAEPNGSRRTSDTGRAHRLPQLRCSRSNSQLQKRILSRSLERRNAAAGSKKREGRRATPTVSHP